MMKFVNSIYITFGLLALLSAKCLANRLGEVQRPVEDFQEDFQEEDEVLEDRDLQVGVEWTYTSGSKDTQANLTAYCFSSNVAAEVFGKGKVYMNELQVGDKVLTGNGNYETLYSINHRHPTKVTKFVQLYTSFMEHEEDVLEITSDHMIFINGNANPVPSAIVKVGDQLHTLEGPRNVTKISTIHRNGMFNPLTVDGTIVVNGIVTSTYSALFGNNDWIEVAGFKVMTQHSFFDKILKPYRLICTGIALELCKTNNERVMYTQIGSKFYNYYSHQNESFQSMSLLSFILTAFVLDFVFSIYSLVFMGTGLVAYYTLSSNK